MFRGRDKEKERGKEKEKVWDAVRPATAGPEVGRERERERERGREEGERPLPPVPPVPVPDTVLGSSAAPQQHRRLGGVLGVGEVEVVSMPVAADGAEKLPSALETPLGLASFGTGNTSVASSTGSNGSMGFKRATRKLSLTAPMLGFGKRDKEKEKGREKAAPSSFPRV